MFRAHLDLLASGPFRSVLYLYVSGPSKPPNCRSLHVSTPTLLHCVPISTTLGFFAYFFPLPIAKYRGLSWQESTRACTPCVVSTRSLPFSGQESTLMLAPANVSTHPRGRPDPPHDRLPMVFWGPRGPQKTFGRPLSETLVNSERILSVVSKTL